MKKGEENQVVSEGISQGEIMPNVDVPALSLVGSIVMKIFIIRKEREREKERKGEGGRRDRTVTTVRACMFPDN